MDGNGLLKTSMEDKMAAGAFGHTMNYGQGNPFNLFSLSNASENVN